MKRVWIWIILLIFIVVVGKGLDKNVTRADTKEVEVEMVDRTAWNLLLVNPWNKIPDGFEVELTELQNGHQIDSRAYPDLQAMMDDMRAEGLSPLICSSYRTQEKQERLFQNKVNYYLGLGYSEETAKNEAGKWVAVPGTSEHQTGRAVDIVSPSYQLLDEKQEETPEQQWLMENPYKYGFILRYPEETSSLTGINYEPWHYRHSGKGMGKGLS